MDMCHRTFVQTHRHLGGTVTNGDERRTPRGGVSVWLHGWRQMQRPEGMLMGEGRGELRTSFPVGP